jgi:hypothetical protein
MLFTAAASVPAQPPSRLRFDWEHNPEKLQDFSDKIMRPRKDLDRATVLRHRRRRAPRSFFINATPSIKCDGGVSRLFVHRTRYPSNQHGSR